MKLNEDMTFSSFVVNDGNKNAIQHIKDALQFRASIDSGIWNLYIFGNGNKGVNKTHLVNAIVNQLKNKFDSESIIYVTADEFINDYINTQCSKYYETKILIIDDMQNIMKVEKAQYELYEIFKKLVFEVDGTMIIFIADRKIEELNFEEYIMRKIRTYVEHIEVFSH